MNPTHLKLLVDTVQQLSLARDLDTIMAVVRTAARQLTGADGATFVLKDGDRCYYADEDAIGPLWKGQRFPLSACISGWAMLNRKPAIIEDIYKDERIPIEAYKVTFVKSLVMMPIRTVQPVGAIGCYWANMHSPTEEEVQLLQSLADITSVSIENVYVYNELEDRVKQRTQELETANKDLESFSHSVSHDLKAPLRSITGYLKMLQHGHSAQLNDDANKLIANVIGSAGNMDKLIIGLLDFSKSSKKPLTLTPLNIKSLVEDICRVHKEQITRGQLVFEISELPDINGDAILIQQVWTNLVSNAVKYSSNKPEQHIQVGYNETPEGITYFVKDNGAGFDMKYYDKLFGIFNRLHSTREFPGNGIGLALVQRIINRHGGKIWAESVPGEGATFYFTMPREKELEMA